MHACKQRFNTVDCLFSIWNSADCQREGPKFGTLDEHEFRRKETHMCAHRQAPVSSRVSPAYQLAGLPWLTTAFPRNVNCSFWPSSPHPHPFNLGNYHQHHPTPSASSAMAANLMQHHKFHPNLALPEGPAPRVHPRPPVMSLSVWPALLLLRSPSPPGPRSLTDQILHTPVSCPQHPPVMALGVFFPLQSSASQDLSLFGGHPVDVTANSARGWPVSPRAHA